MFQPLKFDQSIKGSDIQRSNYQDFSEWLILFYNLACHADYDLETAGFRGFAQSVQWSDEFRLVRSRSKRARSAFISTDWPAQGGPPERWKTISSKKFTGELVGD
ncbi:hypothetical protein [Spirosoma pollinicola]|uniref:Uncharacterized protein n=1 Tax=Spirosoma pollinicola TaxID=2057025 RepID=A0A2K8ZAJ9_9BACT|nr:hypothetical protein [Spirosoma pollinicola]AUD06875.1 hypothetical protein CWM47_36540 [Spirosoma pollinicola]